MIAPAAPDKQTSRAKSDRRYPERAAARSGYLFYGSEETTIEPRIPLMPAAAIEVKHLPSYDEFGGGSVFKNPSPDEIREVLRQAKTIAVVGLSDDPSRASNSVSREMQRHGYRIVPVNPNLTEVLGEKAYASVRDIPEELEIDIVNIFRRSDALVEVVRDAITNRAGVIWAQQGIYNEQAAELARSHGKTMIMDACIMVMHSILLKNQ